MTSPIHWSALGLLALALCVGCSSDNTVTGPKRVILISMDTVRADHVSGYGSADTTPEISKIAAQGARFDDFYSASCYTIPSTMSILTGLDPKEHALDHKATRVSPEVPLLAELMKDKGYRTQAFHEGGYVAGRFGFERGFGEYKEVPRIAAVTDALPDVTQWMRDNAEEPYFLFFHTYAAHFPYGGMERYREEHPERGLPDSAEMAKLRALHEKSGPTEGPREERRRLALANYFADKQGDQIGKYKTLLEDFPETEHYELDVHQIKTSYNERIAQIDSAIGQLRDTLVELGQWEDTLFIIVSDHGEAFYEHGLERHDYVPFNECFAVPLVVSYPKLMSERKEHVVEGLAWHLDLVPTILSIAEISAPTELRGIDLTSVLAGESEIASDRAIYPAVLRPAFRPRRPLRRMVIQGDDKFVQGHEHFGDELGFLFDLERDPGELDNLREKQNARFEELAALAEEYDSSLVVRLPVHQQTGELVLPNGDIAPLDMSDEERQRLANLGYTDSEDEEDEEPEDRDDKNSSKPK